ncbi:hypothetical protein Tco_0301083 [Tanacetum coccineum]
MIDEDYHSIKEDIPLVSVYTTRTVLVRGILILDEFLTEDIRTIDDFKEYEMVFMNVVVPMNQPQPVVSTQGTHRSTPRAHKTPIVSTASPQGKKRKQIVGESSSLQKSLKITIRQKQVVEGEKDDDDSEDRLEPGSHKENLEYVDDDDDEEKVDEKKDVEMGRLETRAEEMQTPIPTTPRSPRTILSSDKTITQELTNTVSLPTTTTSKNPHSKRRISSKYSHLPKFNAQAPKIIEELFKNYVQSNVIQVHPTTTTSTEKTSSADLQQQLYLKMKRSLQDQANDPVLWEVLKHKFEKSSTSNTFCRDDDIYSQRHDDHQEDDAPPEGEKIVKRRKASKSSKSAREETIIDEDKVIPKDETPELIIELQNVNKHVLTIFDRARMEATLNDMLSNQFKNAEEYAYHLEQATSFIENQIVWERRQEDIRCPVPRHLIFFRPQRNPNEPPRYLYNKDLFFLKNGNIKENKYILSLQKIHAERFPEADLEEKMNHWVRKEFKNFNEDARIIEVFRITTDQPNGLDFMEQIIMMRENDKPDSFSKADFKYLNENDIEDLYYLCRNKKVNYCETKLMNSLITFIKSRVIWERVHDFQLGIESYQVKVNLTAPTLTFPGIKAYEPYLIVDKPNASLIHLNIKDEKRVMYLVEIVKICDATLEKVLKEVKLKIFQSEPWKKPHLLGGLDRDIMRAFEREITKRLRAHDKEGIRADVSAHGWSANDWLAPEGTKILPADQ